MPVFEHIRVVPYQSDRGRTVAFVSCRVNTEIGAIYLNDMTLVSGNNGLFLSYPSRKMPRPDAQGREYRNYYFMDRPTRETLQGQAIDEYNRILNSNGRGQNYGPPPPPEATSYDPPPPEPAAPGQYPQSGYGQNSQGGYGGGYGQQQGGGYGRR